MIGMSIRGGRAAEIRVKAIVPGEAGKVWEGLGARQR